MLRLVSEAGGGLRVRSELGQGSTFEVYLPCVAGHEEAPGPTASEPRADVAGLTVLVVEDDDAVRQLAMRALERAGYRAVGATHGREALELVAGGLVKPAVVVTDVVMPELGGRELAERLASVAPTVPVLFVSGYAPQGGQPLATEGFLAKPYTAESLVAAVGATLAATRPG